MSRRITLFACLAATAIALGLSFATTTEPTHAAEPEIEFHRDVVYGKGGKTDLTLNLGRPAKAEKPLPAVLIFHGGGWISGNKERRDKLVRFLAAEGYFAATVGYRLASPLKQTNLWPAQIEDAKCAVRWLRAHCKRWSVDPDRVAAVGISSGGHLAMLLGTMGKEDGLEGQGGWADQSSKINAVVSFFGPADLGRITKDPREVAKLSRDEKTREARGRAVGMVLGPAFRADPSKASPVTYVTSDDAPMLLVQGTRDVLVPYGDAQLMVDKLTRASVSGEVVFKIGLGHGWGDPHLTDTIETTMRFLDRKLRPGRRKSILPRIK